MRISLSQAEYLNLVSHKYLQYNTDGSVEPIHPQGYVWEAEGLIYYN